VRLIAVVLWNESLPESLMYFVLQKKKHLYIKNKIVCFYAF
jgi:hypothetical protein